jgi:hypothetical protein
MGAVAAYSFFPKKPSIKTDIEETNPALIAQLNQQINSCLTRTQVDSVFSQEQISIYSEKYGNRDG